jgi:hypothetical protein
MSRRRSPKDCWTVRDGRKTHFDIHGNVDEIKLSQAHVHLYRLSELEMH